MNAQGRTDNYKITFDTGSLIPKYMLLTIPLFNDNFSNQLQAPNHLLLPYKIYTVKIYVAYEVTETL